MMSAVRNRNTAPELFVRSALHRQGFRFRIHGRDLPGRPDIILPVYRTAVFVHGCFWHGHDCPRGKRPASNSEFWCAKITKNILRDRAATAALQAAGWKVEVIWECRIDSDLARLTKRLNRWRALLIA